MLTILKSEMQFPKGKSIIWGSDFSKFSRFPPHMAKIRTPPQKKVRGGVEFSLFSVLFFYENHQLFVVDMNPKQYFSTFFSKICRTP